MLDYHTAVIVLLAVLSNKGNLKELNPNIVAFFPDALEKVCQLQELALQYFELLQALQVLQVSPGSDEDYSSLVTVLGQELAEPLGNLLRMVRNPELTQERIAQFTGVLRGAVDGERG